MRGRFFVLAALLALAVVIPASASRSPKLHFKVVSAKATATLTFHTEASDQGETSDGKVSLVALRRASGTGALPGKAFVPLKGKISEKVKTKRRVSDTSQYQEQTCSNSRKVSRRGGVTLRRVGSKVEVRWAFPQAKSKFCRGPGVGSSITAAMKHVYPSGRFAARRVTVVVAGSKKVQSEGLSLAYRWRATVKLART